jgi:hypothetical protein
MTEQDIHLQGEKKEEGADTPSPIGYVSTKNWF